MQRQPGPGHPRLWVHRDRRDGRVDVGREHRGEVDGSREADAPAPVRQAKERGREEELEPAGGLDEDEAKRDLGREMRDEGTGNDEMRSTRDAKQGRERLPG